MRLFIALDLPEPLPAWVTRRQKELQPLALPPGLRWTTSDQWHVTLRFLGEWPEHKTAAALRAMNTAAEKMSPFAMSVGKLGSFSGPRMGVLWAGIESGAEMLALLAAQVNTALDAEGFPKELRPFRGHVTLARSRNKIPAAALRTIPPSPPSPPGMIDRLHLYESILSSTGAHYTPLHTVRFKIGP